MTSDRLQHAVDRALSAAFEALEQEDWQRLATETRVVLTLDPACDEARRLAEVAALRTAPAPVPRAPSARSMRPRALPDTRRRASPPRRSALSLVAVAEHIAELVPFPAIATKVISASDDELSSVQEIARLVSTDPALTAKVLQTANSAYYGQGHRITTVREAAVLLGARELRTLALTACVMDALGDGYVVSTTEFWRFSLTVALLADLLAHSERIMSGDAFTAGILHGMGLLALDLYWPDGLQEALTLDAASDRQRRLHDRERAVFGFTDAEVGAELAKQWRLPPAIVGAIARQGTRPDELDARDRLTSHLVRARIFARSSGLSDGVEQSEPRGPAAEWLQAPLASSLARLGGLEGVLRRVDAFLGTSLHDEEDVVAA